jgi:hypothetical protein
MEPIARDMFERTARRCIYAHNRRKPTAIWMGDRTPRMLKTVIEGAPNIYMLRDGRDVIVSWAYHYLRISDANDWPPRFRCLAERWCPIYEKEPERFRDPKVGPFGDDEWVRTACRGWAEYIKHDLVEMDRLKASGTPVLKIVYEEMREDIDAHCKRLYEFLGVDPDLAEEPSEATKTRPGFKKESFKSHYRKGVSGDWRNHFDDRIIRIFKEEAGEALVQAGYEKDLNW